MQLQFLLEEPSLALLQLQIKHDVGAKIDQGG